jgi:xanthosine utilization system XapX-like protein
MSEKILLGILSSFFVFLTPAIPLVILVGLFIIGDTIMGLIKSYILKEDILSRKLARLILKLIAYTSAVLLVYGLDVIILSEFIQRDLLITKFATGVLCFIEGFSIDEKIRLINNDKGVVYYVKKAISSFLKFRNKLGEIIDIDKK